MMVSIIASVYNCEEYIADMVESVMFQTYQQWEMIIIDDASTDNTWKILSQYTDTRIKKYQNNENRGMTVNLNKALEIATGKYIIRIDGDDVAYPRRLEKQVMFMEENSDVVLAGCWMRGFGSRNIFLQRIEGAEELRIHLLFDTAVFHPTFIIRKSILDQYLIRYNEEFRYAQDYELEFRLSKYGKLRNIPEILMKYRYHDKQISIEKMLSQQAYANRTRRAVLLELGIALTDEEVGAWQKLSTYRYEANEKELYYMENIVKRILDANESKKIYQNKTLTRMLYNRLNIYKNGYDLWKNEKVSTYINCDNKYQLMFQMMVQWKRLNQWGIELEKFFIDHNICSIAIYGMGHVGRVLAEELKNSRIQVKYGIDKGAENAVGADGIKIIGLENDMDEVDAIIVTAISGYESIKSMLLEIVKYHVLSLEDIIYSL